MGGELVHGFVQALAALGLFAVSTRGAGVQVHAGNRGCSGQDGRRAVDGRRQVVGVDLGQLFGVGHHHLRVRVAAVGQDHGELQGLHVLCSKNARRIVVMGRAGVVGSRLRGNGSVGDGQARGGDDRPVDHVAAVALALP
jgi:hypothetical protein